MASQESTSIRSSAIEDYAKAIYALELRDGDAVSTNALAERLGVTPASASGMVKRLDELGLVEHQPYRGVSLTEDGRRVALEVMRHHRLLELYLVRVARGAVGPRPRRRPRCSSTSSPRSSRS